MRNTFLIIPVLLGLAAPLAASAKQVEVQCTPKAYSCYNSPEGYVCRWNPLSGGAPALVQAYRDPNYPKQGDDFELYRSRYRSSVDRHELTVDMEFKVFFDGRSQPNFMRATLDAGSVIAEATGIDRIDISLRNHNYGRGYICNSFRVLE